MEFKVESDANRYEADAQPCDGAIMVAHGRGLKPNSWVVHLTKLRDVLDLIESPKNKVTISHDRSGGYKIEIYNSDRLFLA